MSGVELDVLSESVSNPNLIHTIALESISNLKKYQIWFWIFYFRLLRWSELMGAWYLKYPIVPEIECYFLNSEFVW